MAMLIAWQTVNAVRHPNSRHFSRGFLVVAPGITIKDRLRVLLPNDPESYYRNREIVPSDMLADIDRAKIVITNFHAFKLRTRMDIAKATRAAIEGWREEKLETEETEGQMLQRVMSELMGMKNIVVLNDEAHHCYRAKVKDADGETEADLKGESKEDAKRANEAARMWITGLETVKRKLGVATVYDLSATPFFLQGSGYGEGTLFHWTMSDFSLMDAIECGIVKLRRARGPSRSSAVHLFRPALRHPLQLEFPVVNHVTRREGFRRSDHPRARAGPRLSRHLARRHPFLSDLSARPPHGFARSPARERQYLRSDWRRECASSASGNGRGVWGRELH
jgi:hypothetical protein